MFEVKLLDSGYLKLVSIRSPKPNHVCYREKTTLFCGKNKYVLIILKEHFDLKHEQQAEIKREHVRRLFNNFLAKNKQSAILTDFMTLRY